MKTGTAALIVAILLVAGTRGWAGVVINFDPPPGGDLPASLTAMANSPGSTVPTSAQLSNQYNSGSTLDGVLFSSNSPFVAVVSATNPNAIGGVTSGGLMSYADPITFTFVVPGTNTPGVTSNFSIQADASGIPGQFATVTAFDINGNVLDTVTLNDVGSEIWSINMAGIHSATFVFPTTSSGTPTTGAPFGEGTGIALDNLTFGTVTAAGPSGPVSSVPLPPMGWEAMALVGLVAGLFILRQRRHVG